MHLRDYQTAIINDCRIAFRQGIRRVLIQSPTGSGKTVLCAFMLASAADRKLTSWFIVHRSELVEQSSRTFDAVGLPHGIIASGHPETSAPTQVCSIQTLVRRLDRLPAPDMIVFDEAHHVAAGMWETVAKRYPQAYQIGLTATPERNDGSGLRPFFDRIIFGPDVRWLIDNGHLAPYRLFAPDVIDTTGMKSRGGDYTYESMAEIIDKPTITGNAVRHYERIVQGARTIGFAVSVEHSLHMCSAFRAAGYRAEHLDGKTPKIRRRDVIERFRAGDIQLLWNVDLFGEGFDVPACEAAILMRPTQSLGLYMQQAGRVLRPAEGKTAYILDHAGNCIRHGLPCQKRQWTLDSRKRKGKPSQQEFPVRLCEKCFAAMPAAARTCTICGTAMPVKPRHVQQLKGNLAEVDKEALMRQRDARRTEQYEAKTLEELIRIGERRGYKNPGWWARKVLGGRS